MRVRLLVRPLTLSCLIVFQGVSNISFAEGGGIRRNMNSDDKNNGSEDPIKWLTDLIKKTEEGIKKIDMEKVPEQAMNFIKSEATGQISYGFIAGYGAGFTLKRITRVGILIAGGLFCVVQTLAYSGYLVVNHEKIKKDVERQLDVNQDGTVDENDVQNLYDKAIKILGNNMNAPAGFAAGAMCGWRGVFLKI